MKGEGKTQTEGPNVEGIILERKPDDDDLMMAATTGLSFWDNPIDDGVWNDGQNAVALGPASSI